MFLDGGIAAARDVIARLFADRLGQLPGAQELKDPKTRLQEYLQARGLPLPVDAVEAVSGEPHDQRFVASCEVAALEARAHGEGSSRRRAEQEAAQQVLERITAGEVEAHD